MKNSINTSIIIVSYNSNELLEECLHNLAKQTMLANEIIVVNNSENTQVPIHFTTLCQNIKIFEVGENLGFAGGCQYGIDRMDSNNDWVILLNPDAYPKPNWLETLGKTALEHPEYTSFASRMLLAGDPTIMDGAGDQYHFIGKPKRRYYLKEANAAALKQQEVFAPCGGAAMYLKKAIIDVGGFDTDFFCYCEDIDLGFRLQLRGHRCLYVPSAIVEHIGSAITGKHSAFYTYHGHRNLEWVYFKNMPALLLLLGFPLHLLMGLYSFVPIALRGQFRILLNAKRDAIKALPTIWRKRRIVQSTRTCTVKSIWRVLAKGLP